ncbi:hypothetical protein LINGRAHAP2_LOCUS4283, partial [Linum grandiflorum]
KQHSRVNSIVNPLLVILPHFIFQHNSFIDGSFKENVHVTSYGVIIKNYHGIVRNYSADQFVCSSPIMAEAMMLFKVVKFAKDSDLRTIIKSDCSLYDVKLHLFNLVNL